MKSRAFFCALLVGVVSMASGCHCFRCCFPNAGWRFHQGCGPVCAPPCAPCGFRPAGVVTGGGPDCGCASGGGPSVVHQPVGYPPVIGNPMPIPGGPTVVPSTELHNPTPVNPKSGN